MGGWACESDVPESWARAWAGREPTSSRGVTEPPGGQGCVCLQGHSDERGCHWEAPRAGEQHV